LKILLHSDSLLSLFLQSPELSKVSSLNFSVTWVVRRSFLGGTLLLLSAEGTSLDAGGSGELDVLLGGDTDHEGRDVNHLLTNSDVLLADEDTGVMHGGSDLSLHDEGLEAAFHELGNGQTEDVIELSLGILEETKADHTADKRLTFEQATGVLIGEGQEGPCGFSKLGEGQLQSPDFSLVLEAVRADESQLVDKLFLFEGSPGGVGGLSVVRVLLWHLVGLISKAYRYQ
jgi:hypothetical protein